MGRRNEHSKDELRELIALSAEKIIENEGYDALTTRKIATDIGYTVGSLYMVIPNMESLIMMINERTLKKLYHFINDNIKDIKEPEEALLGIAYAYVNFANQNLALWQLIFKYRFSKKVELSESYLGFIQQLFALIQKHLLTYYPNLSDTDADMYTRGLWSSVHGMTYLNLEDKLSVGLTMQYDLHKMVEAIIRATLHGLKK